LKLVRGAIISYEQDDVAVVLRSLGLMSRKSIPTSYQVVGEVYKDGIMDGEALPGCGTVELW